MTTDELRVTETEKERESVVRCAADAFEALKMIPDIDANGPILVWLSDQFLDLHRRGTSTPPR